MDEPRVKAAIEDLAAVLLRWIDPAEPYLIIGRDKATPFVAARLQAGQPINMVGHKDSELGHPIRDLAIYRVTADGAGHNEISGAWAEFLAVAEIAVLKEGSTITVEDIRACATMTAIAFLEAEFDDEDLSGG